VLIFMNREARGSTIDQDSSLVEEKFGCPMLVRNHGEVPRGIRRPRYRCSLGWALHDEGEVDRCRDVESVPACWKVQPERVMTLSPARGSSSNGHSSPVESSEQE